MTHDTAADVAAHRSGLRGTPIIVARDLRKRYGALQAVDGVSFEIAEGEVFGILGPNGAGKTTTLEMIEGMRPIDSGSAVVDGIDVGIDPRRVKARIGIQLQASSFFDQLNLVELLELFGELCDRVAIMDRGVIVVLDTPGHLIDGLLGRGFTKARAERLANLEDVFLDL